jgi:hypothetical protein
MNKALKAKHLTQAADELRVVKAALDWYEALIDSDTGTGEHARYKRIAAKLHELEHAVATFKRSTQP